MSMFNLTVEHSALLLECVTNAFTHALEGLQYSVAVCEAYLHPSWLGSRRKLP